MIIYIQCWMLFNSDNELVSKFKGYSQDFEVKFYFNINSSNYRKSYQIHSVQQAIQ